MSNYDSAHSRVRRLCIGFLSMGLTTVSFGYICGCMTDAPSSSPQAVELSVNLPVVTPQQPETQYRQVKGGLEISIVPEDYKVVQKSTNTYLEHQPNDFDLMYFGDNPSYVYYTRMTKTVLSVAPDRLTFILHINNQMARVFHGGGAVAEFKIAGQELPVFEDGYADLENAIIPPQNGLDIPIHGPKLEDLPAQGGIMGIFLYDLVTNQNDAGVVTGKQEFQWYFNYTMSTRTAQVLGDQSKEFYCTSREQYDRAVNNHE